MSGRVVCVAFDSPDLALLQQGVDAGWLPRLAGLVEGGRFVPLDDLQDLLVSPMWPTMVTGTHVADHLLVCDEQLVPGTYRFAPARAEASRRPPFWRYLSDAGLRSTVASVYSAPLLGAFNGTQVIGWGTHDPFNTKETGPRGDPPEVLRVLERVAGRRAIGYGMVLPRSRADFEAFLGETLSGIEQQRKALVHLLERTEWEFFFGAFSEAHQAGHVMWHLGVPDHPRHDPGAAPALKNAMTTIYRAIDAAIGSILDRLPGDTRMLVVSPYALGPHHHLVEVLGPLLERAGWLSRSGRGVVVTDDPRLRAMALARRALHHVLPLSVRLRLGRLVPRDRWVGALALADVDWAGTRAFPLPSDGSSFLRINLRGREPGGVVEAGAAYDEVCGGLTDLLTGLTDPITGEHLAVRVARADRLFGAPPAGPLPDVLVQWARRHQVRAVEAPGIGTLDVPATDPRTALHWSPGFVLGHGPGIERSGSRRLAGPSARVVDVAATVLALLGVPRPPTLPGRPIPAFIGAAGEPPDDAGAGRPHVLTHHRPTEMNQGAPAARCHAPRPPQHHARLPRAPGPGEEHAPVEEMDGVDASPLERRDPTQPRLEAGDEHLVRREHDGGVHRLEPPVRDDLRHRLDAIAVGQTEPEVPVLGPPERGVEAADGEEGRSADEDGGRDDRGTLEELSREVAPRIRDMADDEPAGIPELEPSVDHRHVVRGSREAGGQPRETVRAPAVVVVEEGDQLTGGRRHPRVPRIPRPVRAVEPDDVDATLAAKAGGQV